MKRIEERVVESEDDPVSELTVEECWSLLESQEFGRLAYRLIDEVHIVPINYLVEGRALLFRTAPGNKLFAAELGTDVAFEIDWYDDFSAWSVVARGTVRPLDEFEAHRADSLPQRSWVPTLKYVVIEMTPTEVSGRGFRLHRPN